MMDNFKWNIHINEIIAKVSKRLHIIRVLERDGVPAKELVHIYYAFISNLRSTKDIQLYFDLVDRRKWVVNWQNLVIFLLASSCFSDI